MTRPARKSLGGASRALLAAITLLAPLSAAAQPYPAKPIRLVNGFAAGGSSDIVARFMAQKISEDFGQPVIVEPKPGAGGVLANEYVAKAVPDGYTLLIVTGAYPVQAALLKRLPFDPLRDLAWISSFTFYPFVVNVRAESEFRSIADLIAYAKSNPGKLNYASNGLGTVHHLAAELFNVMAGVDMTNVPFKGGTAAVTELIAGRVDVLFETMTFSLPLVQSGKLRALAVTSLSPSTSLPGVPPLAHFLPGYEVTSFLGLATTGGVPPAVVERLNGEVRRVLALPDIHQRFLDLGGAPRASSPEEMREFVASEIAKWSRVIDAKHIARE